MRIIGGKHGRRRFDVPKSFNARPTTDFAKENLFNVLYQIIDFEGIRALDCFSGTGSIALELASRGAREVVCVEQRREHASFIRGCAQALREEDTIRVLQADVLRLCRQGSAVHGSFDFIFADPPYKLAELPTLPDLILSSGLLEAEGLLVFEHPASYSFTEHPLFVQHRAYGSVNFSFFSPTPSVYA